MAAGCFFQAAGAGSSRTRRPLAQPPWRLVPALLLLLLLVVAPSCCQATRGMQPFKGKPLDRGTANHFLGFLPRGPVPPSGPSQQHNSIGAQDQSHP
ncbi:protein IDA-LIKE 2-like [Panicum miliaceum]|uniref:Protein IDA-LIKE 2-like n=1 Tax=Panicum miliaceum TaxID=4540 RepID=A0A3L6QDD4_PANMI|nr:protein IDA-LIKE 2-like [Panicum miliaceum]